MSPPAEALVIGQGKPVTVVAHGLGATIAETRPMASGVPGTRVFPVARGHGGSAPAGPVPDYQVMGDDLLHVADAYEATQAIGISMGAGALLAALAVAPDRFAKVVLFLPGALDSPRADAAVARLARLADAIEVGDAATTRALVALEVPAEQPGAGRYVEERSALLLARPALARLMRDLPRRSPVTDRRRLGAASTQVLVIAQEGDALHPADVARQVAAALPHAQLVVFDAPGVLFRERRRLRALIGGFLAEEVA